MRCFVQICSIPAIWAANGKTSEIILSFTGPKIGQTTPYPLLQTKRLDALNGQTVDAPWGCI
jgi:hypothetical protein